MQQGSILGPLLFLVYINNLLDGLNTSAKLFADDTSLFSVAKNINKSAKDLNDDLATIVNWSSKWKMLFNPDPLKPAQEVIFSKKKNKGNHPVLSFNNVPLQKVSHQKHLGIFLDENLDFKYHLQQKTVKVNKGIAMIRKLRKWLPRKIVNLNL